MSLQIFGIKQWYNEINPASLTTSIDVIVVEHADGTFLSSPFYVQFGKWAGIIKPKGKVVNLEVNGVPVDIHMKLDESGSASTFVLR